MDELRLHGGQDRVEHTHQRECRSDQDSHRHAGRYDGRCTLDQVGPPLVKRGRAQPGQDADEQQGHPCERERKISLDRVANSRVVEVAGGTIDQRDAVEGERTREHAHQQHPHACLVAARAVTIECREHVDGQAHQLERDEEADEVSRAHDPECARNRKQHQGIELTVMDLHGRQLCERDPDRQKSADTEQDHREGRRRIDCEHRLRGRDGALRKLEVEAAGQEREKQEKASDYR